MAPRRACARLLAVLGALALAAPAGTARADDPPPSSSPGARAASTGLRSGFDADLEGWASGGVGGPVSWIAVGGDPGGALAAASGDGYSVQAARSPAAWGGDRRDLYGGRLRFDVRLDPGQATGFIEVVLHADDGHVLRTVVRDPSGEIPAWQSVSLAIEPDDTWSWADGLGTFRTAGPADFDDVLGDLDNVTIATFAESGRLYLDDVELAAAVDRSLTLDRSGRRFFGRLGPRGSCAGGQRVTVQRVRPGPDDVVGRTRTDMVGEYGLTVKDPRKGRYYASVGRQFVEGGGDCGAAASKRLRVR